MTPSGRNLWLCQHCSQIISLLTAKRIICKSTKLVLAFFIKYITLFNRVLQFVDSCRNCFYIMYYYQLIYFFFFQNIITILVTTESGSVFTD